MALTVSPRAAEIAAETVPAENAVVFTVNVVLVWPSGTVTLEGTVTKLLLLESPTKARPKAQPYSK
jgi:hypothetical protein